MLLVEMAILGLALRCLVAASPLAASAPTLAPPAHQTPIPGDAAHGRTYAAYLPCVTHADGRPRPVQVVFEFGQTIKPGQDPRDLAVAFHSIQFINAAADVLGTLTFGTAEANALQGQGWYGNETDPGVGAFQWAGGAERRASLQLSLPAGTEGLLLHLSSIADGMSMPVWVDGVLQIAPRVDAGWRQAYVPVGPPPSTPASAPAPQWTQGRYFPQFSLGQRLYAIRVRSVLEDWWNDASGAGWRINSSYDSMLALTLVGMQGVINRNGAWVYLDWEGGASDNPGQHWLSLLRGSVQVVDLDLDGLSAVSFLYRRFATRFQGAVVYDPSVPDTINLATMYAGLENRVMLAPEQLGLSGMPHLANVSDLRSLAAQQGWDTSEDGKYRLYDWVYRNLWPRLEHRVVGVISPGPPTSREIAGVTGCYYPLGMASRDYLVALRLSALWLSPLEEPQKTLLARFVQDAPTPAPVLGFFGNDELGTVGLVSRYGGWCPAFTNGNSPLSVGNVSVLSGVRPSIQRYPASIDRERVLATLERGPVFTMWCSDGDSTIFQMERGFRGGVDFTWEGVQGNRFGWTINPVLVDFAPLVWNDYVATRRGVSLVSGLSGAGYTYPELMSETQLDTYLVRTARYLTETGLRVLHVDNRFGTQLHTMGNDTANQYYNALRDSGYLGAFTGGSGWPWGLGFHYPDTPTPEVAPSYVLRENNRSAILADLLARRPGEYSVDLTGDYAWQGSGTGYPWHRGEVVQDTAAQRGKSLRFSHDDASARGLVVWGPFSALAPGGYDVTFRLKVADNGETRPIAQVYAGIQEVEWRMLGQRSVAPSDFQQAGQYQDITVSFGLERFAQNVEFRLDYYAGMAGDWATTDLYADTIVARRQGGLDMPVFAAAFIALVGPTQPLNDSLQIAQDIERAGGLVLTPDEFMAALNPEYMASLARQGAAANTPAEYAAALGEADRRLREGDYLASLLAARAALRAAR